MNPFLMISSIKELNSKFNVFAYSDGSKSIPGHFLGLRLKYSGEDEKLRLIFFEALKLWLTMYQLSNWFFRS